MDRAEFPFPHGEVPEKGETLDRLVRRRRNNLTKGHATTVGTGV
jgi:hypothetical protein